MLKPVLMSISSYLKDRQCLRKICLFCLLVINVTFVLSLLKTIPLCLHQTAQDAESNPHLALFGAGIMVCNFNVILKIRKCSIICI